jgi:hydrogenase maturation factor
LLISPEVGEDAAAIPLAGEEVLVLKSDPITFTADAAAVHAVTVNVNDVATCGALPRWLLASLLFPEGTTALQVLQVMRDLAQAARANGLILSGGHTEITDAVKRLVVSAQVAGTVMRRDLIDKRNMAPGDRIVLTKKLAIEGTAILAREIPDRLRELGMEDAALEKCREFLAAPGTSVLKEARIAAACGDISAMHDVTEGGISTALAELSRAGGHRILVNTALIPVYEETRLLCRLLGLDPLGLIGSGSLLIACRREAFERLLENLTSAGIDATCIGEVQSGNGVMAVDGRGNPVPWPKFETDEIARLFSSLRRPEAGDAPCAKPRA